MKHTHNHDNAKNAEASLIPVEFEFAHPTASTVCIAGTFNDWKAETKPMHSLGKGRWAKETFLSPGTYEYCLVVDGQWSEDPSAKESVPNPFGGRNSILKVGCALDSAHIAEAEHLPLKNITKQKTQKTQIL